MLTNIMQREQAIIGLNENLDQSYWFEMSIYFDLWRKIIYNVFFLSRHGMDIKS